MDIMKDIIMIIGIPSEYHNTLSKWAAERNSRDPAHKIKPETIAEQAILEYVDRLELMESNLRPTDANAETALVLPNCGSEVSLQLKGPLSSPENSQE